MEDRSERGQAQPSSQVENGQITMMTNILVQGRSGSGKTLLCCQAVKMKISQLESHQDKPVRVIVTSYRKSESALLLQNLKEKYFPNMNSDISVKPLKKLCEDLNIDWDRKYPKEMINKVVGSLSASDPEQITIFMCDELYGCHQKGQVSADWSDLSTAPNVVWILSVNPMGHSDDMQNFRPPSGPGILSTKLVHGHRNCYQIRSVSCYFIILYFL